MEIAIVILAVVVGSMLLFWGSRVGPRGLRITVFGLYTVYEENPLKLWSTSELRDLIRKEVERLLPPPEDEEDDDDEDNVAPFGDGRDLWDRLEAAGFITIDENRDLRLKDSGNIDWSSTEFVCAHCKGKVFQLWELYRKPSPSTNLVARVKKNPLGHICASCGMRSLVKDEVTESVGVIGPVIDEEGANFFDVLDLFESLRKPPAHPEVGAAPSAPIEGVSEPGTQTI